jgi:hypothetical protein
VKRFGSWGSFLAGDQSGDRTQDGVEVFASAEVTREGPPVLQVADAVLDADPLGRVSPAFGLVRRGDGGEDRDLVLPPGRPRSEHRTGGLGARSLTTGVARQGDAGDEGQQLDQPGLADLGQNIGGARAGRSAAEQSPLGVGDHQRLDRVRARLTGDEPLSVGLVGRRAAYPHLGGIEQTELPAGTQVGDHIGSGAQPDSASDGASPLGQQRAHPPTARVIVERDTPTSGPTRHE